MSIQVVNKGIDISPALQERVSDRVEEGLTKYFDRPGEAYIVIERDGHSGFQVHCSLHLPTGTMLQTSAKHGGDAYIAADEAMEKLETRLRRYKRKLRNHHRGKRMGKEAEEALYAVLQAGQTSMEDGPEENDDAAPPEAVVVSERMGELRTLTVSMAVMDMDISDAHVLLFRNIANGQVNALYRRPDGHIGWMNPQQSASTTN
ncbi:Ribosome hibernation promoting factor Hpf [hydrothermal vent metagenome]|uniref:Ribosome hibernation promoting factor Hpf n=1 Tax=hydrothermal vent metagenome TaxID=652676 RepID=A0A3B0SPQ3_9ZZZZ